MSYIARVSTPWTDAVRKALCAVCLLSVALSGCAEPTPAEESTNPAGEASGEVLVDAYAKTREAGDARVLVEVSAQMPEDFDDGVPRRSFDGKGVMVDDGKIAAVIYDWSDVPNGAGFLGHARRLTVVFGTGGFTVSFAALRRAVTPALWVNYELDDFSSPKAIELGIGQLRELGMSDPLLALAYLQGADDEIEELGTESIRGTRTTRFRARLDLAAAFERLSGPLKSSGPSITQQLRITDLPADVWVDGEGVVRKMGFTQSYAPAPGSEKVTIRVTVEFYDFGIDADVRVPPEKEVIAYDEYLTL